jgi:hypothetical protein
VSTHDFKLGLSHQAISRLIVKIISSSNLYTVKKVTEAKKTRSLFKVLRVLRLGRAVLVFTHGINRDLEFMSDYKWFPFENLVHISFLSLMYVILFGHFFDLIFQG